MDLETENRIAAILLKEAAELRRQAEKEGALAYLRQPKARARPNSRFLTATVLGVQQANRAVEVNEMWRSRQKELEMDNQLKGRQRDESSGRSRRAADHSSGSTGRRHVTDDATASGLQSSDKRLSDACYSRDEEGLKDVDLEKFLHSRVKRGRGSVGSRMDETGPYLPRLPETEDQFTSHDVRENRVVLGPEKPSSVMLKESSDEDETNKHAQKKEKVHSGSSEKQHYRKRKSKEKSRDKKGKSKEKSRDRKEKSWDEKWNREEKRIKHRK